MKKKITLFSFLIFSVITIKGYCQAPDWTNIKANYQPTVAIPTEFGTPYIQPLNTGGWEDGLFISRDGLHLYAFYMPVDVFSWQGDINFANPCPYPGLVPYYRGPLFGIDTVTAPPPCTSWNHSDILYAKRTGISMPFTTWTASNLATSLTSEGAPHSIPKNSDTADVFVFNRANPGTGIDIMIMQNVPNNPDAATADTIKGITTTADEGNPHIERIDASNLVLFFNNEEVPATPPDIFYSTSSDNGANWQPSQLVTSVNTSGYDIQPHLYNDGTDWWLYCATADTNGLLGIFRAKQTIPGNWNSWGTKQLVIGLGSISGGYGQVIAIGEPTLTQWGDISFVVVYGDTNSTDTTDMYDADPWFLPRIGSPTGKPEITIDNDFIIYPNPMTESAIIEFGNSQIKEIRLINMIGKNVFNKKIQPAQKYLLDRNDLMSGMYILQVTDTEGNMITKKLVIY